VAPGIIIYKSGNADIVLRFSLGVVKEFPPLIIYSCVREATLRCVFRAAVRHTF